MTLTQYFIPYKRQAAYDAQIAALDWDRQTLPDAMQQEQPLHDLASAVHFLVTDEGRNPDVFVSSNTILCYDPTNLNRRLMPDLYVAFGVDERAIRERDSGYFIWEVGKPPDFVLEFASPSTARNDLTRKRDLYEEIGIAEYWRFDRTGGDLYGEPLVGESLVNGVYERLPIAPDSDGHLSGYSPVLDLNIASVDGLPRLSNEANRGYSLTVFETQVGYQAAILENEELRIENDRLRANNDELMVENASQRLQLVNAEERTRRLEEELRRFRADRDGE